MAQCTLVLVSRTHNGKRSLKLKARSEDREALQAELDRLNDIADKLRSNPDYRILGPRQLDMLKEEIQAEQQKRRAAGAKKAAQTRAKRGAASFVLCPTCSAKSKKLRSEFGGLETRVCQRGHRFEYDRWIADRAFWNPAGAIPNICKKLD